MDPRTKLRSIALLRDDDPGYIAYVEGRKLEAMHIGMGKKPMCATDRLSRYLEPVVRAWVNSAGDNPERILTYETLGRDNRYHRQYREMDFVTESEGLITVGELKVSYSSKSRYKAHRQLWRSYEVIHRSGRAVRLLLIHINLIESPPPRYSQVFRKDFNEMEFRRRPLRGNLEYHFLEMEARGIFAWAVSQGFIPAGQMHILEDALQEAAERAEKRGRRLVLRASGVPYEKWPKDLHYDTTDAEAGWVAFGDGNQESVMEQGFREAFRHAEQRKGKP